jgi:hypothetical protein
MMAAVVTGCSGDKFSPSDDSGNYSGSPALNAGGSINRGDSGNSAARSSSDESEGGESADISPQPPAAAGSGGSYASAGSSAVGGAPTAGGTGSSGGSNVVSDCAVGKVTFKMLPSANLEHDYLCDAGCGTGWLSITDAEGATAYSPYSACGTASCETCEVQTCAAAACLPKPLTVAGSELSWDGSYFAKDVCGANMACQKASCVKPGKYKAKACAAINAGSSSMNGGCMPKDATLCAEAVFEFPGTSVVKLVLEP